MPLWENKQKWAVQCSICYGPWTAGVRHRTQPKTYDWQDASWKDWESSSRSASRASSYHYVEPSPSPRHRSNQQRPFGRGRHAGKGKNNSKKGLNQGRGQQQEPASPFQTGEQGFASWHSLDASKFMPTSELAPSPSASVATAFSSADQEGVQPLRKAYPDPSTMPEDTKLLIEKADRESGRLGIKNLRQATKYLGKAKKHLAEVSEQQSASSAVDGSPCCRNPGVGGAIERLPQTSDPAYRSGKSSPNRDQCDQQDHPTTQQPGSWWNCLSQSTGTFPLRGGRLDGGCC